MFDLLCKIAIVTGGANGIGAQTVQVFLDEGAKFVAFLDIDKSAGYLLETELKAKYGINRVKFIYGDVTKDTDWDNIFNYTIKNYGHIDLIVNNAGIARDDLYKRTIDVNFQGVVTGSLKALELMRKDKKGKGGTIINISSIYALSLEDSPTLYVYSATKSGVLLFSNNLGADGYYSYTGVRVITMTFGLTKTNILLSARGIDDISTQSVRKEANLLIPQTPRIAAEGIAEAYKKGKTGSTWLVNESKITDITQRIRRAYKIMSGEIE